MATTTSVVQTPVVQDLCARERLVRSQVVAEQREEWTRLSHPWFVGRPIRPVTVNSREDGQERLDRLAKEGRARVGPVPPVASVTHPISRGVPLGRTVVTKAKAAVRRLQQAPKPKRGRNGEAEAEPLKLPSRRMLEERRRQLNEMRCY